jgi:hypothetical protein
MEPNFYRRNLDRGSNLVDQNRRFQHSHDKLCAQCIPYHREWLAFPFQKELQQSFLVDLGINTGDLYQKHQFIP